MLNSPSDSSNWSMEISPLSSHGYMMYGMEPPNHRLFGKELPKSQLDIHQQIIHIIQTCLILVTATNQKKLLPPLHLPQMQKPPQLKPLQPPLPLLCLKSQILRPILNYPRLSKLTSKRMEVSLTLLKLISIIGCGIKLIPTLVLFQESRRMMLQSQISIGKGKIRQRNLQDQLKCQVCQQSFLPYPNREAISIIPLISREHGELSKMIQLMLTCMMIRLSTLSNQELSS